MPSKQTSASLLVEVFACSWQAGQLFVENVFFGAHAVTFHVLGPVKLTHIKIKDLQKKKKKKPYSIKKKTEVKYNKINHSSVAVCW